MPKDTSDEVKDVGHANPEYKMTSAGKSAMRGETAADKQSKVETKDVDYSRPSHYRDGVQDQAWENIRKKHGKVIDPQSKKLMKKEQPWDMGHKPGFEFNKLQADAKKANLSRDEFLDIYNNPKFYRPELPSSNRNHKSEARADNDKYRKTGVI
jgi:predicted ribonuclease toxin of YeeF-YezG toxin-antitoxin module